MSFLNRLWKTNNAVIIECLSRVYNCVPIIWCHVVVCQRVTLLVLLKTFFVITQTRRMVTHF